MGYQTSEAASFSISGDTLYITLDVQNQFVAVVSNGTNYTFTLSGGASNTWTGATSSSVSVSSAVLTITATGLSTFSAVKITDSQTGTGVNFNTSGANVYAHSFIITLDETTGRVSFNGNSSFSGTNSIDVTTSGNIIFLTASSLTTVNGDITLVANMQAVPNDFAYSGIEVKGATVEITGSGSLTMRARGGSTGTVTNNDGIVVHTGGRVIGGTAPGTTNIEGRGYTGLSGSASAQGVVVTGSGTVYTSTISSNGSNVVVTGYGANNLAAAQGGLNITLNVGVLVGQVSRVC